jgi:serine/threonine protein kinase
MSSGRETEDRQRWAELKARFNAALEQPPENWPSLVSGLRDSDPEQADQLQRLLDGHRESLIQVDPLLDGHGASLIQVDPHDPDDIATGTTIGPYVIAGLIGEGGMGRVYRAKDARLGRDVAIKVLPPDLAHDQERRMRMEREARAMGMLNHPNIVTVYDIGDYRGSPYIVSELLEGQTLREHVTGDAKASIRLEPEPAVEIVVAVAAALGAAHARGIVHRDIKPENVFLCSDGRIKVLDFGIAKLVDGEASGNATMTGAIVGTLGYITPEQLRGQPVRPQADVYACGVVLYELMAGARPFAGASQAALIGAILLQPAPRLAGVPPALEALVARCLAKEPEARFADGGALAGELRALRGLVAGRVVDPHEQPTQRLGAAVPADAAHPAAWRRWTAAAVGAVLLASVVGLVWRAQRDVVSPASPPVATRTDPTSPRAANPSPTVEQPQRRQAPPATSPVTAPAPTPPEAGAARTPGSLAQQKPQTTAPAAPTPQAATPPAPAVVPLSGVWTFSEQVTEVEHAIECTASGGLQLQAADGVLDGTLQLKEACTTKGATESNDAVVSLRAGAVVDDAVSFVTQSVNADVTTTCRYTGRIVGSARGTMIGEVACEARRADSRDALTPRGTWRANRTTP